MDTEIKNTHTWMIHHHFRGRFSEWHITIALWVNSKQSFSCFFLLDRKLFWSAGDSTHQVSQQVKLEALSFRCQAKCFEKLLSPNNRGASTPESASQSDAHLRVLGNEMWGKAYISKCFRSWFIVKVQCRLSVAMETRLSLPSLRCMWNFQLNLLI